MIMCMYKICITNRKLVKGDFIVQLKKVVKTDVSAVILREKDLDEAAYEELLKQVMPVCKQADIPLIAHKYINAAIKNGISYIHLPVIWTMAQIAVLPEKLLSVIQIYHIIKIKKN